MEVTCAVCDTTQPECVLISGRPVCARCEMDAAEALVRRGRGGLGELDGDEIDAEVLRRIRAKQDEAARRLQGVLL